MEGTQCNIDTIIAHWPLFMINSLGCIDIAKIEPKMSHVSRNNIYFITQLCSLLCERPVAGNRTTVNCDAKVGGEVDRVWTAGTIALRPKLVKEIRRLLANHGNNYFA